MEDRLIVDAVPYLNRYALMLTKNKADADDLVSMTVIKAIEIVRFNNQYISKPKPYLARIMRNTFISEFCRKKRTMETMEDYSVSVAPRQENIVLLSEVRSRIEKLPYHDKRVITAHMDGCSLEEMSGKFRGYRTTKPTMKRTIDNFKKAMTA